MLDRTLADVRKRIARAGKNGLNEQNTRTTLVAPVLRAIVKFGDVRAATGGTIALLDEPRAGLIGTALTGRINLESAA